MLITWVITGVQIVNVEWKSRVHVFLHSSHWKLHTAVFNHLHVKVDNFVSKNWHMECGRWICQTKRDHVKFIMTEGCGHYSLCVIKSLLPVLASSNSEDLCNRTIVLSWIRFPCCFNVELAKATCIPSLPSFFWTNTVGKAQGLLFSIDLGQQFGFSSTQLVLPSCVGLWMKCHLSTKSCLIIIPFSQLVLAFQEISFLGLWIIVMLA